MGIITRGNDERYEEFPYFGVTEKKYNCPIDGVLLSEDFDYDYRKKVYEKNDCRVIFVHKYKEKKKWKYFLLQSIQEIQASRNNKIDSAFERAKENGHIRK